jgi:translation initiation factor IF-1
MSGELLEAEGVVVESRRGDTHLVDVEIAGTTHRVLARRAGRLGQRHIRLLPGDKVRLELSPYDLTRGRVILRLDKSGGAT